MAIKSNLFFISILIHCFIHSSRAALNNKSAKSIRKEGKKWTLEEEKDLMFFDALTNGTTLKHFERIKSCWHDTYPNSNVTDAALRHRLYKLREESQEGEVRKYFKWNQEKCHELLDVYYNTYPYKKKTNVTLEDEWTRRYKDYKWSRKWLRNRVRKVLLNMKKDPKYSEQGTSHMDFEWNTQLDSDLLHVHNVVLLEGEPHWRNVYQIWSDLHPQYSHLNISQLRERLTYLKDNSSNKDFPWTEEENRELLDIFYKTMPDEEDQGHRIYDIWSKIHPQYKFMTPYYLQIHASTLAHRREMQEAGKFLIKKWTDKEKADLSDIYRRHLDEPSKNFGFYKEWILKHPRRAFYTNKYLKLLAREVENEGIDSASEEMLEGSSHETNRKHRMRKEQELHEKYNKSSSKDRGYSKRLMEKYDEDYEAGTPMRFVSMKKLMARLEKQKSEKPHGKAKMVYHLNEQEPSTSRMSDSSV